jgi:hypothetical protein
MSSETTWWTRTTDKLRELLLPALTLAIVGSVWCMGYLREKEAILAESFAWPVGDARLNELEDDEEENATDGETSYASGELVTSAAE